jgi:glycine/serine hydroxymethyltransferase
MMQEQMITLGHLMMQVLRNRDDAIVLRQLQADVSDLAAGFPAYADDFPGHV